ncbi:MAG: GNAT family N-acetyltransferase [Clostridiales bacterium]|nr:GNAT family N-acetyltransferase [Clostridiales bacterium]
MDFKVIKGYKNKEHQRNQFNHLAEKTFGLNFEDWYQNGFWREHYIPYSVFDGDRLAANVSVNIMDFICDGEEKHLIQLGTVMTDEAYRNRGLIRRLMEEIENDYGEKTDGMYLFANDSVLEFYPKFGYTAAAEYQYTKNVSITGTKTARQISMKSREDWAKLEEAMIHSVPNSRLEMKNNVGLLMFYVTKFMQENVYYIEEWNAWVAAEQEEGELMIHHILSDGSVELQKIIEAFGDSVTKVRLGFTPIHTEGFALEELREEDTTLFVKGSGIPDIADKKLMFPTLSHA